jgi:hypothetical protein
MATAQVYWYFVCRKRRPNSHHQKKTTCPGPRKGSVHENNDHHGCGSGGLRVGNSTRDLILARDIVAGTGKIFNPQAIIVATWYKVDSFRRQIGQQNTFQLIMPYSATGETWAIFAYTQLEFFRVQLQDRSTVCSTTKFGVTDGSGVEQ